MPRKWIRSTWCWWGVFLCSLAPLALLGLKIAQNNLGTEPAKYLVEFLGEAALVFLLTTLAITPLNKLVSGVVRFRRMLGLYTLFFAVCHVLVYGALLVDWNNLIEDLYKRPYITMGFLALLALVALGVTSNKIMMRKLGKNWKRLHRLVYPAAVLVIVHFWWQVRADFAEPLAYALVLLVLLSFRFQYFKSLFRP